MSTDIDFQITECPYQLGHIMSHIEHVEAHTFIYKSIEMRSSL